MNADVPDLASQVALTMPESRSVSFIVIGLNEARYLERCFLSITQLIRELDWSEAELIYVDSGSTDGSLELAQSTEGVTAILQIEGDANAAIARNIGAAASAGDVLCFVDGDMEVRPHVLARILRNVAAGASPVVACNFFDVYGEAASEYPMRFSNTQLTRTSVLGGLFVCLREVYAGNDGMSEGLRICEDLDLGLRLSSRGYAVVRDPEPAAMHYTVPYESAQRFYCDFRRGNFLYLGVLLRKNLLLRAAHRTYARSYISAVLLGLAVGGASIFSNFHGFAAYTVALLVKSYFSKGRVVSLIEYVLRQFLVDLSFLVGFFLFYPKANDYRVVSVQRTI